MNITGKTGSLTVTSPADAAPSIEVHDGPFTVDATLVETVVEGSGEIVPDMAMVQVDYHGVNGRNGQIFDSSWMRGEPVEFPLNGVVTGFAKAIAGQKCGSDVVVAMTPGDGYGENGNPMAGIKGTDVLTFYIRIHKVV